MHTRKHRASALTRAGLVLFILLLSAVIHAQITPLGDSYTNSAAPTTNYGAKTLLDVDGATQITYIQFNLASIPFGASVSQATLKLYVNSVTTTGSFNVDYVNGTWSEGTITWNNAPAPGSTIVSSVPVTTADKNQYILINLTPAVEAWLNGSQANDGIALVANGSFNATFDSKENTGTSHPAELDVVFAGGGGTITGVETAAGSGLQGGGTSGTLNLSLLTSCASNQILQWTGSAWACASAGTGTITGVTAGTDLTGGGTSGNVTLNLNTTATDARYAQLAAANTFTGNQTVNGNVSASGYQIGGTLFDYGSSSNQNAFLGFAGNSTTTGSGNIAAGYQALAGNTTGSLNAASGYQALYNNNTGNGNVANGGVALLYNTSGSDNTAIGSAALPYNTTGSYNTAAGFKPGAPVDGTRLTGSGNTFLGAQANPSTGGLSNATAIGANSEVGESNAMVLGCTYGVNGCTSWVAVGIGTPTPAFSLDVNGWINAAGYNLGGTGFAAGSYPARNASLGFAGNTGYGTDNTAVGYQALYSNQVSQNTAVGSGALRSNAYGVGNTAVGYQTLNSSVGAYHGGIENTAVGYQALYSNNDTSGTSANAAANTAVGYFALLYNTTGANNAASGAWALWDNTTGSNNTAVGGAALEFATTGSGNTALGSATGLPADFSNMTGSNNTFVGASATPGAGSLSNATAIGALAEVDSSNALVLGSINGVNNATSSTNVGIGTTAPSNPLTVASPTNYIPVAISSSNTFGTWLTLTNSSSGGKTWNILSAGPGNSEGAGNLAITNLDSSSTVYIHSNLHVDGNVSKGGGSFKIDHPLDPANKYLSHSFVESPDMMNIYNGNVVTDKRGLATIELPDWFEALNRDFRYQLTVIGQFAQAIVVKEVKDHRFTIKSNRPGVKVSWQVTGIRQDAYANAHRIPVEEVKPPQEQGHYLHPELFGAGPEQAVGMRAAEPSAVTTAQATFAEPPK